MEDIETTLSIVADDADSNDPIYDDIDKSSCSNSDKLKEEFNLVCNSNEEPQSSHQSVTSFIDGQAVQLEDGSTAYIYRKLKENMDGEFVQAIDLEDGTTAYIHHQNTNTESTDLSIDEENTSNFKCDEDGCGKLYSSPNHLRVHKRTHTGEKPFGCTWDGCGKSFATSYALKAHIRVHTGEKPYDCTYPGCNKAFKTSGDLQKHNRTHTGEKPFKCPFEGCGKSFTTSNICKVHIRVHTGERPYKCPFPDCEKSFTTATNYKNHVRIHTGEKPFACEVEGCGRRFTEYSSFYKHRIVHAAQNPYVCQHCDKCFWYPSSLLHHKKAMHGDESAIQSSEIVEVGRKKSGKKQKNIPRSDYTISNMQMKILGRDSHPQKQVAAVVSSGAGQQLAIISHDGSTQFTLALTDQGSTILLPAAENAVSSTSSVKSLNEQILYVAEPGPSGSIMQTVDKDNTLQRMEASETSSSSSEPTPINTDIWLHQPQKDEISTIPEIPEVKDPALKMKDEENLSIQLQGFQNPCVDHTSPDSIAYLEIGGAKYQLKIIANDDDSVDQMCVGNGQTEELLSTEAKPQPDIKTDLVSLESNEDILCSFSTENNLDDRRKLVDNENKQNNKNISFLTTAEASSTSTSSRTSKRADLHINSKNTKSQPQTSIEIITGNQRCGIE